MATAAQISARIDEIDELLARGESMIRDETGNSVEIDLEQLRKERNHLTKQQIKSDGQTQFRKVVFTSG